MSKIHFTYYEKFQYGYTFFILNLIKHFFELSSPRLEIDELIIGLWVSYKREPSYKIRKFESTSSTTKISRYETCSLIILVPIRIIFR